MNVTCYYSLESNPEVGILVLDLLISYINYSPILIFDINIENFCVSHGHIDDNFLEKILCHSRDSNHRYPVLALTN